MQALPQLRHEGWHRLPGLVVALAGILASYGWWQYQEGVMQSLASARFERQAIAAADALQRRVESKGDVLMGLRGLLMVNPDLTRADFERVAQSLKLDMDHASVLNLHFTRAVPASERAAFEARARVDPHLDGTLPSHFTVHPLLDVPEHFVVDFVWPVRGNEQVQGLDIHSQPINLQSYLVARRSDSLVVSAPFATAQLPGGPAAINIRLPVFLPAPDGQPPRFLGAVGAVVGVSVLMDGLRQRGYLDGLLMSVHDIGRVAASTPQPGQPLYVAEDLSRGSGRFSHDIGVGGRLWRLEIARSQTFLTPQEEHVPAIMAGGALIVTALLAALVSLLARRRLQALAHAELASRAARESESRFRAVFNQAAVGMAQVHSTQGDVVRANRRFCELLGYGEEEIARLNMRDVTHPDDVPACQAMLARLVAGEIPEYRLEQRYLRKDGSQVWVDVTVSALRGDEGPARYHIVVVQDITERRNTEDELRYLAYNDLLTGLPNRRLLMDRLEQALVMGARHQTCGAVLLLDLDQFKTLNETRGHEAGDQLLRGVAERLRRCLGSGDTLARQGGDEFVAVLRELGATCEEAAAHAEEVARRMLAALHEPFALARGEPHHTTLSIGVTVFGSQGEAAEDLIKHSELAMYEAKAAGRNTLRFFDPQMQAAVAARVQLEADMRAGLAAGQFELYYQPKMADGRIRGAEALLRWRHPQRGFVSPAEFIPLAEDCGLILQLGQWVLQTACAQLAAWSADPLLGALTVAVNVSPRQFHESGFVAQVLQALAGSGAEARRLRLELTEGMLLQDMEDTIAKMVQLRGYGVGFALDDFGTGYSSLAYLKRLPLHELKIDQGFVRDVLTDPNDAAIARTIIALGSSLGLVVVAEGVETEAQRAFLERHGCRAWQGYLLAPPLPRAQFEALVAERAAQGG